MMHGKKDIKKNIFLWNVHFNQFLLFEIKHPDFEELDCQSYSGTNIQKENVHLYNNSNNTGIALLQVSKLTLVFVPKPMSNSILWKGTAVFHMLFHCKEMLQAACALSLQILRKYGEWLRPAAATGIGLGLSFMAKGSLAIQ